MEPSLRHALEGVLGSEEVHFVSEVVSEPC